MKRYTTVDESLGLDEDRMDEGLSLQGVCELTDWSEEEFDQISDLLVGEKVKFNDVSVERTE